MSRNSSAAARLRPSRTSFGYDDRSTSLDSAHAIARSALSRLYTALKNVPAADVALDWEATDYARRFRAAMDDDFNTVEAVAVLFELAGEANKSRSAELAGWLKTLGGVLGLLQRDPVDFLQGGSLEGEISADEVEQLIAARKAARAGKDWAESDRIRDELIARGIVLEDGAGGTTWRRA